jgi:VanZ family protein
MTAVLWPGSQIPSTKLPIDKLVHFVLFTGWTSAFILDFNAKWVKALAAGLLFALFTELIQIPIEKRSFDVNDVLADGAGILFAIANSTWIIRLGKRVLRR